MSVTIKPTTFDLNKKNGIDAEDLDLLIRDLETRNVGADDKVEIDGREYSLKDLKEARGNQSKKDDILAAMRSASKPAEPKDQPKKLSDDEYKKLGAQILQKHREIVEQEKTANKLTGDKQTELQQKIQKMKAEQKDAIEKHQYQKDLRGGGESFDEAVYRKAGLSPSQYIKGSMPDAQASVTPRMGKAQTLAQSSPDAQQAKAQSSGGGGTLSNAKASTSDASSASEAFLQMNQKQDALMSGWDLVSNTKAQANKMTIMLQKLMKLAMGGDTFWMAQLVKFMAIVVSQDKSQQLTRLVQLNLSVQDKIREATETLLNTTVSSGTEGAAELTKATQLCNNTTSTYATCQKVLAMETESLTQGIEMYQNLAKNVQEVDARVKRRMTQQMS